MKIETNQPVRSVGKKTAKRNPSAADFSSEVTQPIDVDGQFPLAGVEAVPDIGGILALQEMATDSQSSKRAVQQGHDLLDQLDRIRLGILTGNLSKSSLEKIAAAAQSRENRNIDPKLKAILDDIHLRAQVELAKIEQALASK